MEGRNKREEKLKVTVDPALYIYNLHIYEQL